MSTEGTVTVCSCCGRAKAENELYGDPCGDGCEGSLNQHEDGLQLEIRRLQSVAAERAAGTAHEVQIGEQTPTVGDGVEGGPA